MKKLLPFVLVPFLLGAKSIMIEKTSDTEVKVTEVEVQDDGIKVTKEQTLPLKNRLFILNEEMNRLLKVKAQIEEQIAEKQSEIDQINGLK